MLIAVLLIATSYTSSMHHESIRSTIENFYHIWDTIVVGGGAAWHGGGVVVVAGTTYYHYIPHIISCIRGRVLYVASAYILPTMYDSYHSMQIYTYIYIIHIYYTIKYMYCILVHGTAIDRSDERCTSRRTYCMYMHAVISAVLY